MFILLLSLLAAGGCNGLVTSGRLLSSRATLTCSRIGVQCSDDCSTLMTCIGTENPISSKQCNEGTPKKPHCINSACSASPDTSNANCFGPFICTEIGYFPDADNCIRYHYCAGVGYPAETYECDSERIYDAEARGCVIGVAKRCDKNTCPKKAGVSVAMKPNGAYYMFCDVSPYGWTQKVVLRCQLEDTHLYNEATQSCQFNCKAAGDFTDRQDCNKFHSCTKKGTKFTYNHYSCSAGFYFNGERCVPEIEGCIPQIPVWPRYVISTGEVIVNVTDVTDATESAELGSGEPIED